MRASLSIRAAGAVTAALLATGCATKRYVRDQISPVQQRTEELARKNQEALAQIAELDEKTSRGLSRVEERAMGAENRATQAGRSAEEARQAADQAARLAQNARRLGEENQGRLGEVTTYLENVDKYRLQTQETILFGFNRSTLTPEARRKLDALLAGLGRSERYVLEVAGYADPSGPQDYNLALSRRRADAVVRYLVSHEVPLRKIHVVGLGESSIGEGNGKPGPADRQAARRVEIKVYLPEAALPAAKAHTETAENRLD